MPACFHTESFEQIIGVGVLREVVVSMSSESGKNLVGNGSPGSLPLFVFLAFNITGEAILGDDATIFGSSMNHPGPFAGFDASFHPIPLLFLNHHSFLSLNAYPTWFENQVCRDLNKKRSKCEQRRCLQKSSNMPELSSVVLCVCTICLNTWLVDYWLGWPLGVTLEHSWTKAVPEWRNYPPETWYMQMGREQKCPKEGLGKRIAFWQHSISWCSAIFGWYSPRKA